MFTEYERLILDIQCNPGKYAKLCCLMDPEIQSFVADGYTRWGPTVMREVIEMVCACNVNIPKPVPTSTIGKEEPTPVSYEEPPTTPGQTPEPGCEPGVMPPPGATTNGGVSS